MSELQPAAPDPGSEPKPLSARVPEKMARGVFANGFYVTHGPNEFVLDFAQRMVKPFQVAARVIPAVSTGVRVTVCFRVMQPSRVTGWKRAKKVGTYALRLFPEVISNRNMVEDGRLQDFDRSLPTALSLTDGAVVRKVDESAPRTGLEISTFLLTHLI